MATPWPFPREAPRARGVSQAFSVSTGGPFYRRFCRHAGLGGDDQLHRTFDGRQRHTQCQLGSHRLKRPGERHRHGQRDRRSLHGHRNRHRSNVAGLLQPDQPDPARLRGTDRPDNHLRQYAHGDRQARGRFGSPAGEEVAVTVDGVTHDAQIAANGSFSTAFAGADVVLNVSSTAYIASYVYLGDGAFLAAAGSSQLTVNPAKLTITATSDVRVYDGTTRLVQVANLRHALQRRHADRPDAVVRLERCPRRHSQHADRHQLRDSTMATAARITQSPPRTPTGTITPASLTIIATTDTKVYDGTTSSPEDPDADRTRCTAATPLTGLTQAFASKDVLGPNATAR